MSDFPFWARAGPRTLAVNSQVDLDFSKNICFPNSSNIDSHLMTCFASVRAQMNLRLVTCFNLWRISFASSCARQAVVMLTVAMLACKMIWWILSSGYAYSPRTSKVNTTSSIPTHRLTKSMCSYCTSWMKSTFQDSFPFAGVSSSLQAQPLPLRVSANPACYFLR